ncbi:MAG: 4Fe-4S binding protein [Candidatus Lokiarchaeota archaeon]|nr:4Fe-4S binding protein [Candidatus Lokiarchaeota archaeon]
MAPPPPDPYRALQQHLDTMPVRFPRTMSGVEVELLKYFFDPDEALLALHLDHVPRPATEILERWRASDLPGDALPTAAGLDERLDRLADKGALFAARRDGTLMYSLHPFVAGMYELACAKRMKEGTLTRDFLETCSAYTHLRFGIEMLTIDKRAFRTIPIEASITPEHGVATYDQLERIIEESTACGVLDCICKVDKEMRSHPCKRTARRDTCMAFNDYAEFGIEHGSVARKTKEEMLAIARLSEREGLVLQPENTARPNFICACCDDCCGFLELLKAVPRPVDFAASNFHAKVDADACAGCGTCARRCPMGAIVVKDQTARVDLARCIGCGVCVPACKAGAIHLVKKAREIKPVEDFPAYLADLDGHRLNSLQKLGKLLKAFLRIPQRRD